jgi:hypothetical protein
MTIDLTPSTGVWGAKPRWQRKDRNDPFIAVVGLVTISKFFGIAQQA